MSGRGLHLAHPRPDGGRDQGSRWRRRRGPHREELHRRRHELRDGGRSLPRRRRRGRGGRGRRRCRRAGLALYRRSSRRGRDGAHGEDRGRSRGGAAALKEVADICREVNAKSLHGHGAHVVHGPGRRDAHLRARRRRDRDGRRHPRRARPRAHEDEASVRDRGDDGHRDRRRRAVLRWATRCSHS